MKLKRAIPFLAVIGAVLLLGGVAHAAGNATGLPYWGPLLSCNGGGTDGLPQCTNFCDILATFKNIVYFVLTIALLVVAPAMFLWGGFRILTAGGNEEAVSTGRKIMTGAAIGLAITLGAFVIMRSFIGLLGVKNGYIQGFDQAIQCTAPANPSGSGGCTSFTTQSACTNAPNCTWNAGANICIGTGSGGPAQCTSATCSSCADSASCFAAGCSWDSINSLCR